MNPIEISKIPRPTRLPEGTMFYLTEGEKLLIVAVCMGLLLLTIFVTVCVVSPFCWLHSCIKKFSDQEKKKLILLGTYPRAETSSLHLTSITPQYSVETPLQRYNTGEPMLSVVSTGSTSISQPANVRRHTQDSTYSSMSTCSKGDGTSMYSETSLNGRVTNGEASGDYGQVTFGLRYKLQDGQNVGQLVILLKEVQDLLPRQYGGTCDPYLIIQVHKDKVKRRPRSSLKQQSIPVPVYECRTTTKKKTQHALFKETFVAEISKSVARDGHLRIIVCDDERYSNDGHIGEVVCSLKQFNLLENQAEQIKTLDLEEPRQKNGEILFGLSYLPTAERITFSIVKATGLRPTVSDIQTFAPYIRVLLIHNGKQVKKKKTTPRQGTTSPIYNECLTFDLPPSELDNVSFLVVVSHRDPSDGGMSSPESPTNPTTSRKDRHVGKVAVGACSRGSAYHHWAAMRQTPRKQVTQWHTLW